MRNRILLWSIVAVVCILLSGGGWYIMSGKSNSTKTPANPLAEPDHKAFARKKVTEENYRKELDKLEKEIKAKEALLDD